jgi:SAM-dependent methyltransferase
MGIHTKLLGLGKGSKKIEWMMPYIAKRRVLDLGCAGEDEVYRFTDNWLHGHLASAADYCMGLDSNEEVVKLMTEHGYNVILGDAQSFSIERECDVVVAADILEHLDDWKGFFKSVRKALKDEGYLLLCVPNPWFFLRFLRCVLKGDGGSHPQHTAWFCCETITGLLNRNGFGIEEIKFGSSEPIFYKVSYFRPVLFHTSIFVAARKKRIEEPKGRN